ncbi:MAG: MoaF N-terminal domain-containing protein, partial [Lachnospiraceae bacterium]
MAERHFIGLSQYRIALNYELAGRHFHLVMDSGAEISLNFVDGENVQIAEKGQPYVWESYECLKGDTTTFLVHIQPVAGKGLINRTFVLDTAQDLVTEVLMEEAFDKEHPRLIRTTPFFGAIKVPGKELPTIRHHLSKRMVGRHIVWHYNDGMSLQHIYYAPNVVRASPGPGKTQEQMLEERYGEGLRSDDPETRAWAEAGIREFRERNEWYPFYEEECFHVWISDRLNLFCFVEENMTMRSPG